MQMLYKYHNGKPEPHLLVSENFNEFDVTKFWVINGCWDGRYVSGAVFVDCKYKGKWFVGSYEIYKFKEAPPKDCLDACDKMNKYSDRDKLYEAWFLLFNDLVEKGEIL